MSTCVCVRVLPVTASRLCVHAVAFIGVCSHIGSMHWLLSSTRQIYASRVCMFARVYVSVRVCAYVCMCRHCVASWGVSGELYVQHTVMAAGLFYTGTKRRGVRWWQPTLPLDGAIWLFVVSSGGRRRQRLWWYRAVVAAHGSCA